MTAFGRPVADRASGPELTVGRFVPARGGPHSCSAQGAGVSWAPKKIIIAHGCCCDRDGVTELQRTFRRVH